MLPGGSRRPEENLPPGWRLRRSSFALGPFLCGGPRSRLGWAELWCAVWTLLENWIVLVRNKDTFPR
jgi:hypothetical protein